MSNKTAINDLISQVIEINFESLLCHNEYGF